MQRDETVSEITLDPAIEKGKITEHFSISVQNGGEYDLVISKPGALSYKITGITANGNIDLTASGAPEISSPELIPGDITGDGFIDGLYLEAMGGSQQESSTTLHTFDSANGGLWWGSQGMQ